MDPDFIGALSLMLVPGTPLYEAHRAGRFSALVSIELLCELRTIFAGIHLSQGLFHAHHASNYLPFRARLPKDKSAVLNQHASAFPAACCGISERN